MQSTIPDSIWHPSKEDYPCEVNSSHILEYCAPAPAYSHHSYTSDEQEPDRFLHQL